jgi:hypothetical protein
MTKYKGKRLTVTMPDEIFSYIESLAQKETRTNSQAALVLLQEAIAARDAASSKVSKPIDQ